MSKREDMDQLSRDACDALAHGMTYGKYMAWKRSRDIMLDKPIKRVVGEHEAVCKCCGKVFTKSQHYRVYCSRLCRATQQDRVYKERAMRGGLGEL